MALIKSKINSLAWLKSAIYVSFIGGGVLSSFTPVLAASLSPGYDNETSVSFSVSQDNTFFGVGSSRKEYEGTFWKGTIDIEENKGIVGDELVIRVYLQHRHSPHEGDSASGRLLTLGFRVPSSSTAIPTYIEAMNVSEHPGIKHYDVASGLLTVNMSNPPIGTGIRDWDLAVSGEHNVPEPTTILSAAVALGWGGWMKRKNSIKQDKTKSQG
jgi:hypothetical protein